MVWGVRASRGTGNRSRRDHARAPLLRKDEESRAVLLERIHAVERRILIEAIERWICERS